VSHVLRYPAEFRRSRSNGTSVIKDILMKFFWKKIDPSRPRLSKSLKVIGTDRDRSPSMTSY